MNAALETFDAVLIGSSPIVSLEACSLAAQGKRVLLLDAAEESGGAWRCIEVLGYKNVEIGPHCLSIFRDPNAFLTQHLKVGLSRVTDPKFVIATYPGVGPLSTTLFNAISAALHVRAALMSILRGQPAIFRDNIRRAGVLSWRAFVHGLGIRSGQYFSNGLQELMDAVTAARDYLGVSMSLRTRAHKVYIDPNAPLPVRVDTSNGPILCNHLIMTRHSKIEKIELADNSFIPDYQTSWRRIFYFTIKFARPLSYQIVKFKEDRIGLLANLSYFLQHTSQDHRTKKLLTLSYANLADKNISGIPVDANTEIDFEEDFQRLRDFGLISKDAELDEVSESRYEDSFIEHKSLDRLRLFAPSFLTVLEAEDLTESIAANSERWLASGFSKRQTAEMRRDRETA